MKVYLIHPKTPATWESLSEALNWWDVAALTAPRQLAVLAALTPADVTLKVTDQQAGDPVDFEEPVDLVVVVASPEQLTGLRYLAGRFRARKIPVVIAGSLSTKFPSRADFADAQLIGDLETLWPELLRDRREGTARRQYVATAPSSLAEAPLPRWDLLQLGRYRQVALEVTRRWEGTGLEGGAVPPVVDRRPVAQVVEELQGLIARGVRRVRLESHDLLEDPDYAHSLLEALANLNAQQPRKVRFETTVGIGATHRQELLEQLRRANVRRVGLALNAAELSHAHAHEDPRVAIEAVRMLLEHGIRVVGTLTVFRDGDDAQGWDAQAAVAREAHATPIPRAARAFPGTPWYERLRASGRLHSISREAELRQELFDAPNFSTAGEDRTALADQLKAFILDLYSPGLIEERLQGLFREARRGPAGELWPPRDDLEALVRMLMGSLQHRDEQRIQLVGRALRSLALQRPPVAIWSQGLEQLLEEAALRSFVLKSAEGRPLQADTPAVSLKQRAVGWAAKAVGALAQRRAGSSQTHPDNAS